MHNLLYRIVLLNKKETRVSVAVDIFSVAGTRTDFYYNGNILAGQKAGSTTIVFMYDEKGDPFGFKYNDEYYAYIKNLQDDVVAIADKDRNIIVRYTYDSWGKLLKTEGTLANTIGKENPIRYRSYYYDTESGYYFLQSRYYDPNMCRFLNADTQLNSDSLLGYNMFAYCENNPIMFCDHTGHSITVAAFALGCIVVTGIIDICSGNAKRRADAVLADPSLYNVVNWATMGAADTVKGAVAPEEPLSLQHWMDSLATASMLMPVVGAVDSAVRGLGRIKYPPNNGFNATPRESVLQPGSQLQRIGGREGRFVSPQGTPSVKLSLPLNKSNASILRMEVLKPIQVQAGTAMPWFGQVGGGTQFLLPETIEFLENNGYLHIFD